MAPKKPPQVILYTLAVLLRNVWAQDSRVCPRDSNTIYTDVAGVQYIMRCSADTSIGSYGGGRSVTGGFSGCFAICSAEGAGACSGFTYVGGENGVGTGTCYLKGLPATNAFNTFTSGGGNLVSAIRTQYYPPTPPNYQCPIPNDFTVVSDPNTPGTQYAYSCGRDTIGNDYWNQYVTGTWNDCIYYCSRNTTRACYGFTHLGDTGVVNGNGTGQCFMKSDGSLDANGKLTFGPILSSDGQSRVAAIKLQNVQSDVPVYTPPPSAIPAPVATAVFTQVQFLTQTVFSTYPVTITSVLSRVVTLTSSLTLTATRIATLPDITSIVTSVQVVPTTIITIQVTTITTSTLTTQQIVTYIPTTVLQTNVNTISVQNTVSGTRTTTANPTTTVTPTISWRQTVTARASA